MKDLDRSLTSDPSRQANLLFQATGGPTIPCDLSDITVPPSRKPFSRSYQTEDIQSTIKRIKQGKAPGADGITDTVILKAPEALATALAALLNLCVTSGSYPRSWKQANLKKPGKPDYTNANTYRPIALLSCLIKVLEATLASTMQ